MSILKESQKIKALKQEIRIFCMAHLFFNRFLHVIWLWKAIYTQIVPVPVHTYRANTKGCSGPKNGIGGYFAEIVRLEIWDED